jgi:serine protease Do
MTGPRIAAGMQARRGPGRDPQPVLKEMNMQTKARGNTRRMLFAGVALSAFTALAVPVLEPQMLRAEVPASESLVGPDGSYAEIVRRDRPAIVTIETRMPAQVAQMGSQGVPPGMPDEFFRRFFGDNAPVPGVPQGPQGQAPEGRALGSGFIISADGYIVTNNHVIDKANAIKVTMDDGREFDARLVGTDPRTDIAVLKVEGTDLPTIGWGNSDKVEVGDKVIAIGNPFGVGPTVTAGIVSARGRDLHNGPYDDFLQVDAAINHGNSGGALISTDGKVVGITSAIYSPNDGSVGVGFAIPSDMAATVVSALIENGSVERGYLGVKIQPLGEGIAGALGLPDDKGALVAEVTPDTPAAKAGMKQGDVVIAVNGAEVADARALTRAIAALKPGTEATLAIWRDGAKDDLTVTLGSLPGDNQTASAAPGLAVPDVPQLGLSLQPVQPSDREGLGLAPEQTGLVVTAVDPSSEAADKGIAPGDVILTVSNQPVSSAADLAAAAKEAADEGRPSVLLLVARQGEEHFVALPVKAT